MIEKDVIIIGGGAAGLFCAMEAGKRGRRVLVIEHAGQVGKKIAISGGGRCNFTNLHTTAANFISANPHFAKSALARYTPADFVSLVERHGIAYHEKKLGQLFCDGSARQIINLLLAECSEAGVEIRTSCRVRRVERGASFRVETEGESFTCASLVVATGGLSIPQLGATDFGYLLAKQFDLRLEPTRPALVPLTLHAETQARLAPLSGVSLDALARCGGATFRENILVTHRGLSGPAILQISSYWQRGAVLSLDLLPDEDARALLLARASSETEPASVLAGHMPRRFAQAWCELYAPAKPLRQFTEREIEALADRLQDWQITPAGTEGYKKAEVTAGGVATSELSSRTLEATRVPGLYFIGEVVDVTGHLGGYNFQWAWASGYAAGQFC
ncbi:MAG TPA: NAD(P)/FAD-dependent oxidoreductase [Pyrinomonadaceae bacterium]|nr:NAD(P)/FAD-dependent oxidoreductase [Pyrinomonadaceae bacterium]